MARADLVKQRLCQRQVSSHAEVAVICYLMKAKEQRVVLKIFQHFVLVPFDISIELLKSVSNHHCYYIRLPFGR